MAEQSFIAVKPDGVQRKLVGEIITRFEQRGYKLVGMKMIKGDPKMLEQHYADLKGKPFFASLIAFMSQGPIVAMVWEGLDIVKQGRKMLGETDPLASLPGTIRGDYSINMSRNVIHGSDSLEMAKHEIPIWFKPEELVAWENTDQKWLAE